MQDIKIREAMKSEKQENSMRALWQFKIMSSIFIKFEKRKIKEREEL